MRIDNDNDNFIEMSNIRTQNSRAVQTKIGMQLKNTTQLVISYLDLFTDGERVLF